MHRHLSCSTAKRPKIDSQTFVHVTAFALCLHGAALAAAAHRHSRVAFKRHVFCVTARHRAFFNGLRALFNATKEWQTSRTIHCLLVSLAVC